LPGSRLQTTIRPRMWKILRIIIGVVLIVLGLLALATPLTPGSWLALIGLELLGIRLIVQRKILSLLPPKPRAKVEASLNRLMDNRWFRRLRPKSGADAEGEAKDRGGES
jgi:hypothetical protein